MGEIYFARLIVIACSPVLRALAFNWLHRCHDIVDITRPWSPECNNHWGMGSTVTRHLSSWISGPSGSFVLLVAGY